MAFRFPCKHLMLAWCHGVYSYQEGSEFISAACAGRCTRSGACGLRVYRGSSSDGQARHLQNGEKEVVQMVWRVAACRGRMYKVKRGW